MRTIVIDGRNISEKEIRQIAIRDLLEGEPLVKVGKGHWLRSNEIKYFNVKSVCDGIIVASLDELQPSETQKLAKEFLNT